MHSIVVIGLGSMGKRRIRLLKQLGVCLTIYGIDKNITRCNQVSKEMNINTFESLDNVFEYAEHKPIAAVISTSPLSHTTIITECLKCGLHVFTELNLVSDGYDENIKLAKSKDLTLFLSSTFLYREEIKYIRKKVASDSLKVNYTYHVGQYLPDWHPWENYKDFFVSDKKTNGCREILAIELPWLQKTFGEIVSWSVMKNKCSNLLIDYPDIYQVLFKHSSGVLGALQVDIISRRAVRNLEIYGENLHIQWDGTPDGLFEYNLAANEMEKVYLSEKVEHIEGYSSFVIENAYKNELRSFLDVIWGTGTAEYSFEEDKKTLRLIDAIEGNI